MQMVTPLTPIMMMSTREDTCEGDPKRSIEPTALFRPLQGVRRLTELLPDRINTIGWDKTSIIHGTPSERPCAPLFN